MRSRNNKDNDVNRTSVYHAEAYSDRGEDAVAGFLDDGESKAPERDNYQSISAVKKAKKKGSKSPTVNSDGVIYGSLGTCVETDVAEENRSSYVRELDSNESDDASLDNYV